ncbi:MAG: patatin-like phospholipase family protein [Planctomycetaceae bacterium]
MSSTETETGLIEKHQESILLQWLSELLQFFSVHLWTVFAAIAGTLVLVFIPQIFNLWWQRPSVPLESFGFWLFLSILAILYPVTLIWLWQRTLFKSWKPQRREALINTLRKVPVLWPILNLLFLPSRLMTSALFRMAEIAVPLSHGLIGTLLIVAMVIGGYFLGRETPLTLHTPYLMFGGFLRMLGMGMIFVAIWLGLGKFFGAESMLKESAPDGPEADSVDARRRRVWHAGGRVLSWIAVVSFVGEAIWVSAAAEVQYSSFRLYSIWAAFHIPVAITVLAALVDYAQQDAKYHVRLASGIFLTVWAAFPHIIGNRLVQDDIPVIAEPGSIPVVVSADWLDCFEKKIDGLPDGPAVVVAASGGGSRAALFAALVLQHLADQPMTWTSQPSDEAGNPSDGSPASDVASPASATTSKEQPSSRWADHIALISSVSGGSLSAGRFAADPSVADRRIETLRYTTKEELEKRTLTKVQEWIKQTKSNGAVTNEDSEELQRLATIRESMESPKDSAFAATTERAFESAFADDMCADFMAPMLRGALTPFSTRGDCLYHFWNYQFGWKQLQQNSLPFVAHEQTAAADSEVSKTASTPLVMFNTTDVETGRRVVVGFPSIPSGFFPGAETFPQQVQDAMGMQTRSKSFGPVSLADFSPPASTQLSLARAIRLSSNFPWGFGVQQFTSESVPSVDIQSTAPSVRGKSRDDGLPSRTTLELIDGGVVDNTGIDSVYSLFEAMFLRAEADPFGREARIIYKLRKRGVVFVEIDSGAKPTGNSSDNNAFGEVLRPLTALNNSSYTNSLRISDSLIHNLLLRLAVSQPAARLSTMSFGAIGTENPYFRPLSDEQVHAAIAMAVPAESDPERALRSFYHFRFSCNHVSETKADVMTAFALGPADKAIVMAMFLSEAQKWNLWQSDTMSEYSLYRNYFRQPEQLSKDSASQLAFQLIDRIQTELGTLAALTGAKEKVEPAEKEKRLKRIVTLLLGLRTLSKVPGAWNEKSELWQALSSVTTNLDQTNLAAAETNVEPTVGAPSTEIPVAGAQAQVVYDFNPDQLSQLYQQTNRARAEVVIELRERGITGATDLHSMQPGPEGPVTDAAQKEPSPAPYVGNAVRKQAAALRKHEQQSNFFESKK